MTDDDLDEAEQAAVAALVGRTIETAALEDHGDTLTGYGVLTLVLDDGRTFQAVSSGWHDISSLWVEMTS